MSSLIDKKIKELVAKKSKETPSVESKLLDQINSVLLREDILKLDNDKVDTLRLLTYLIENDGKVSRLVKFLKS